MPFNVLLLPLLGGYFFVTNCNCTRFEARRCSGERLIFFAAAAGIVFLVLAFALTRTLLNYLPQAGVWWRAFVPFEFAGTSLLALILGVTSWIPLNWLFFPRDQHASRTIERWNNFLELMLYRAQTENKLVSVTLCNRKVYIGLIVTSFDPVNDRKYITLMPMKSGYRTEDTLQVMLTTDYANVYAAMIHNEPKVSAKGIEDFEIVIPISELQTVSLFDPEAYTMFNPIPTQPKSQQ